MRASAPIPGNPWPHDMMITVEDSPHALNELLWVREAWALHSEADDLPPRLTDTPAPAPAVDPAVRARWSAAWPDLWRACVIHAAKVSDPGLIGSLVHQDSAARAAVLAELRGPSWRDEFGDDAFTSSYNHWNRRQFVRVTTRHPEHPGESPERKSLDALISAWRAGMTKLVLLPCRGTFTRVIGPSALLLTVETRDDPVRYAAAIGIFA